MFSPIGLAGRSMKNLIIWAVILGVVGYGGSKFLLHHKVEKGVDTAVLIMSPFVNVEYDGVSSTMTGELTIDGIRAQINGFKDEIYIERLGIDTPSYFSLLNLSDAAENVRSPDDLVPEYFGFIAEGVHMSVNADYFRKLHNELMKQVQAADTEDPAAMCTGKYGFSPEVLSRLGYSEQVVSVSAHFRKGESNYSVALSSTVEDMWHVDAELTLAGDMVSEMAKGPRYRPRMSSMRVEYVDQSLNARVADYCGRLGLSEEQVLTAQVDKLQHFGKENGIEFDEYVIDPFTEFLKGKSTLVVTADPTEPVSISQIGLYKPSDVPALLDLSAEAF